VFAIQVRWFNFLRKTVSAASEARRHQYDRAAAHARDERRVGGETLAGVLRTLAYGASVAACGNAGGATVNTTVLPFILRGVNLLGIDSLPAPITRRQIVWERLAQLMPAEKLDRMMTVVRLDETPALANEILAGQTRGRIVVDVNA
jgi:acrylyl-CoA reductase (NADPH)